MKIGFASQPLRIDATYTLPCRGCGGSEIGPIAYSMEVWGGPVPVRVTHDSVVRCASCAAMIGTAHER